MTTRMTTSQIAAELGVYPSTVKKWCKKGCPHEWDTNGTGRWYDLDKVRSWHSARVQKREEEAAERRKRKAEEAARKERIRATKRQLAGEIAKSCWAVDGREVSMIKKLMRFRLPELEAMHRFWGGMPK